VRSSFAVASIITGIFCFFQFFGAEKAILAIIFGVLAFNEIKKENLTGRNLAVIGVLLGIIYIVILIAMLPYLTQLMSRLTV
jgi:hypothetical protein